MATKHKIRLGILASGNGTNLQSIIDEGEADRLDAIVACVISNDAGAFALERARRHGIPDIAIERDKFPSRETFERAILSSLREYQVELVCLAGYMKILGPDMLATFKGRIINIHPALLPSFPGLEGQKQALDYGVKIAGCTVHVVDEKTDHGPIICQAAVDVLEGDTVESLGKRILKEEHRIYPKAIQMIADGKVNIDGRRVSIEH